MRAPCFRDREEAGRKLAARLAHLKPLSPIVLALPRGGVPVAVPVAAALGAPLDLLLVRKIGAPGNPEYGIGAVVDGAAPHFVLDEAALSALRVAPAWLEGAKRRALAEIERRRAAYLAGRAPPALAGRCVVLVDDGIATGGTVRVALRALAAAGAARRVVAAPVAPAEVAAALAAECEELVLLHAPAAFDSVGRYFRDFRQLEDAEVIAALRRAAPAGPGGV